MLRNALKLRTNDHFRNISILAGLLEFWADRVKVWVLLCVLHAWKPQATGLAAKAEV